LSKYDNLRKKKTLEIWQLWHFKIFKNKKNPLYELHWIFGGSPNVVKIHPKGKAKLLHSAF
jgi:hypothetical protein